MGIKTTPDNKNSTAPGLQFMDPPLNGTHATLWLLQKEVFLRKMSGYSVPIPDTGYYAQHYEQIWKSNKKTL